jgi:Na+-transporting NADH:ubiquinone oxidoreductase subunit NqrB
MAPLEPIAKQAVALATDGQSSETAVQQLVASGDRVSLRQAQSELVQRVHERSDDFAATAALSLVNKALAIVGWTDPFSWKHRRKP